MPIPMLDVLWLVLCAGLVFNMQIGFLCLESGLTRSKNAINVAVKNMADLSVAIFCYWLFGFGLMFGATAGGWYGEGFSMLPFADLQPNLSQGPCLRLLASTQLPLRRRQPELLKLL